jgi:hypothetical protein
MLEFDRPPHPYRKLIVAAVLAAVAALFYATPSAPHGDSIGLFGAIVMLPLAAGAVLALVMRRFGGPPRTQPTGSSDRFADSITDVINVSRIRVTGIGGLGLVAIALAVAIELPRVGLSLVVALGGSIVAAACVILFRRRRGPLGSDGEQPGARTMLIAGDDGDGDGDEPAPAPHAERERDPFARHGVRPDRAAGLQSS